MTTATPPTLAPPPDDPVRAALEEPATLADLRVQALSRLNRWLADRPKAVRVQEAEGIVDETVKRAWQKRAEYDPARPVGRWLYGILLNVTSEKCRELRKQPVQLPAVAEPPARERLATAAAVDPTRLLSRLAADDRKLVVWAIIEDLSHKEIGERLNIREGASRQRLHRILDDLRDEFTALLREGDQ